MNSFQFFIHSDCFVVNFFFGYTHNSRALANYGFRHPKYLKRLGSLLPRHDPQSLLHIYSRVNTKYTAN